MKIFCQRAAVLSKTDNQITLSAEIAGDLTVYVRMKNENDEVLGVGWHAVMVLWDSINEVGTVNIDNESEYALSEVAFIELVFGANGLGAIKIDGTVCEIAINSGLLDELKREWYVGRGIVASGLQAWYRFDSFDEETSTLTDLSGNANDATVSGTITLVDGESVESKARVMLVRGC